MQQRTMENLYDNINTSSAICSPELSDDISLLLRQILFKSSSPSFTPKQPPPHSAAAAAAHIPANGVGSCSDGTIDYDPDEYDCESEEGFDNLMEEMAAKPNPPRNISKRTRAAEVHNMSEKRRRSRINEKMKALQKLIPNSNKTDKASMLDEAIEYLKQLQLQVQMLTMRNGINLYSMCAPPDVLEHYHRTGGLNQGNRPTNMTVNQERLVNPMLNLPVQCASQNQPLVLDFSHSINHEPTFGTQRGSS
ncbi:hypothetical protein L6452_41230 [Arctium lappa]|uniref:Uncharacterized protein n=1 Tax=Arctium lappa TaxID=4217 RepID=A0ACB8XNW0_ARCLA|nr:hypothetical protein L6452_41230 [Arctium lappa]